MTGAALGVAATGSLLLAAGPRSPRAVSLLPAVHVCLVCASDVVADLASAFASLPAGAAGPPSALTWIGGPSRTGDLEMRTTIGVHGPRVVDVVIVDGGPGQASGGAPA